jgi:YcxB-like protein
MEVEYECEVGDALALAAHLSRYSTAGKLRRRYMVWRFCHAGVVFLALGGLIVIDSGRPNGVDLSTVLPGFFYGVLCSGLALGAFFRGPASGHGTIDARDQWYEAQRLIIGPDGITQKGEWGEATFRWPVVWSVDVTDNHCFLWTSTADALVLPRRVFQDETHFNAFIDLVNQYRRDATRFANKPDLSSVDLTTQPRDDTGIQH